MKIDFVKMHGLGNDFILIDCLSKTLGDSSFLSYLAKRLCNRNFGIGADGLILVLPSSKAELKMRIFNSDGSEAQMCGNGIRCFAKYAYENKLVSKVKFTVETLAGIITPELIFKDKEISGIKVDMGIPKLKRREIPMEGEDTPTVVDETSNIDSKHIFKITCVSMGNPHCIIFVNDVKSIPVDKIGPKIENHPLFPDKTNVEFIQVLKALCNINRLKILFLLSEHDSTWSDIVFTLRMNSKVVRDNIIILMNVGFVQKLGKRKGYRLTERGQMILKLVQEFLNKLTHV